MTELQVGWSKRPDLADRSTLCLPYYHLPAPWNADVMNGIQAATLEHAATLRMCWGQQSRNYMSPVSDKSIKLPCQPRVAYSRFHSWNKALIIIFIYLSGQLNLFKSDLIIMQENVTFHLLGYQSPVDSVRAEPGVHSGSHTTVKRCQNLQSGQVQDLSHCP